MARVFKFVDILGCELHTINDPEDKLPIPEIRQFISIGSSRMRVESVAPQPNTSHTPSVYSVRVCVLPAAPTRYVGVFCPDGHFNVQDTYEVEHSSAPCALHWVVDKPTHCKCRAEDCGMVFRYGQGDVAHSNWPDGREPEFPHRR